MDLVRAAFLLENELRDIQNLPVWKRRDLENVARASIRAMREAAERIEQLEASAQSPALSGPTATNGRDDVIPFQSRSGFGA